MADKSDDAKRKAKAAAAKLRKQAAALDKLAGNERTADAERKRAVRAAAKLVIIPPCADPERRVLLESDDSEWLRWYFPTLFWYQFTEQQQAMIAAIRDAILHGGDQALAASRGEGKTKLAERVLLKHTLQGNIKLSVLFAATGSAAGDSLQSIMAEIEGNERLLADYPEVCVPVVALENTPQRGHTMLVSGTRPDGTTYDKHPAKFSWCGNEVSMPNVPGSPSAGAIIATRGLDAAVRGLNKKNKRVDVAVIDDPDTDETVYSEEQADKLEKRIDRAIAGLGGQQRSCARVMLCTLQNHNCVAYRFTDSQQKPSWQGRRFRFLVTPPDRLDLWDEYVTLRAADWQQGTELAAEFYAANTAAMERGAVVANPNRYTSAQFSALQFYYDQVARLGPDAVATEYDNDPPAEAGPIESGITAHRVQRQLSGFDRLVVPPKCVLLTSGIDVRKTALHWVVKAWEPDATGYVIDYGVFEVLGTKYGSDDGLDIAIQRAILARVEAMKATEYVRGDGEIMPVDLTLVDAGWRTDSVYSACAVAGAKVLMPVMGFGRSSGCTQANFHDVQLNTPNRRPGDGWFLSRKGAIWLVASDADRWKAWLHDRWMTAPGKPGSLQLFGTPGEPGGRLSADEKAHHSYARHITSEIEVEELVRGVMVRKWKAKNDNNHWFDASCYAAVAASMKGIKLATMTQTAKPTKRIPGTTPATTGPAPSLAQLAAAAKRAG